jgi:dipeptidyl aminopeptidase/acylaminoacyl peptidase
LVAGISEPQYLDDDPTLTADMREIYFNSDRPGGSGGGDIWVARRSSTNDTWGVPEPVVELNSPQKDSSPEITPDGLTLFFASERSPNLGRNDIWVSTRPDRTSPWEQPTWIFELSSDETDWAPSPSPDGTRLVLSSNRDSNSGHGMLFLSELDSVTGLWSDPEPIDEINLDGRTTSDAVFGRHINELYYHAARGTNDYDLWVARRPDEFTAFAAGERILELSTGAREADAWLSRDGRTLFFTSDRGGTQDIWMSTRH